jgi:hypothetical protein
MGREADSLDGLHGTHPDAVVPICENGFDKSRRSGQVFGAGEYFAKNPSVSVGYCRGGEYLLVCRLTLGEESSTPKTKTEIIFGYQARVTMSSRSLTRYFLNTSSSSQHIPATVVTFGAPLWNPSCRVACGRPRQKKRSSQCQGNEIVSCLGPLLLCSGWVFYTDTSLTKSSRKMFGDS